MFKNNDVNAFTDKINKFWIAQEKLLDKKPEQLSLVSLDDVYFHNNSKRQFIYFLLLIGIFILAIAIVNFINLTIAKSSSRAREIGMRKVVGAPRKALIIQFLSESVFISILAMTVALMMVEVIKPDFYKIVDKQIPFDLLHQPSVILLLITGIIIIGIISGIYPAIILSAFKPTSILKGEITKGKKGNSLR
jgi:putative ABC transport system permease protein